MAATKSARRSSTTAPKGIDFGAAPKAQVNFVDRSASAGVATRKVIATGATATLGTAKLGAQCIGSFFRGLVTGK